MPLANVAPKGFIIIDILWRDVFFFGRYGIIYRLYGILYGCIYIIGGCITVICMDGASWRYCSVYEE